MSLDAVTTEQRMALESAVGEYLDAGATQADVLDEVQTFMDDLSD